jgi:hypothetical protein
MLAKKIKWFIHPVLAAPIKDIDRRFRMFTDDMNYVIGKTNKSSLIFDGVTVTAKKPGENNFPVGWAGPIKNPADNYNLWAWIDFSPGRNRGTMSWHYDGTGILDCGFEKMSDPENPGYDYDIQLYVLLHEYAHNFGAGIGEYYRTALIPDKTGTDPYLTVSTLDPDCRYWSKRQDFLIDPLLRNTSPWTAMKFSELTATIIDSGKYRISSFPVKVTPENDVLVKVFDSKWAPIPQARIEAWKKLKEIPERYKIVETDNDGASIIDWGIENEDQMTTDPARLIKVYASDYLSAATHFTLWDHQYSAICKDRGRLVVRVMMLRDPSELTEDVQNEISEVEGCIGWSVYPDMKPPMPPRQYRLSASCLHCSSEPSASSR